MTLAPLQPEPLERPVAQREHAVGGADERAGHSPTVRALRPRSSPQRHDPLGVDPDQRRRQRDRLAAPADLDPARHPRVRAREVVDHDRGPPAPRDVAELLGPLELVAADVDRVPHRVVDIRHRDHVRRAVRPDRREPPELLPAGEVADLGLAEHAVSHRAAPRAPRRAPRPRRTATSGTTPVPSQLLPLTASRTTASGTIARTSLVTRTGVMWSAAPGVRSPTSRARPWLWMWYASASPEENVRLADQHGDRRARRQRQLPEAPGRPPLARAVAVDHVRDVRGPLAEQPVEHERHRPRIAAAVAPQVEHHAARPAQQRERGLADRARRGARCRGCRARARRRRRAAAAPRRPSRPAARPRRDPAAASRADRGRGRATRPPRTRARSGARTRARPSRSRRTARRPPRACRPRSARAAPAGAARRGRDPGTGASSQPQRPEVSAAAVVMPPAGAGTAAARRRSARRWTRTPARSSAGRAGRRRSTARRDPRRTARRPRR